MKTKTIKMPEALIKRAEAQANDKGYGSFSEYIRNLVINDLDKSA